MSKLKDIAATVMDMYHQNYAKDDEFFGLDHFQYLCAGTYASLISRDYENAKAENKAILGFSFVSLPAGWVQELKIPVKQKRDCVDYIADIGHVKIFNFPFDSLDSGIQAAYASGSCEGNQFVKIASKDTWRLNVVPASNHVFYYRVGCEIRFKNVSCDLKEVVIQYLPDITSEDGEAEIPTDKVMAIINVALQIQLAAKKGEPIDFSIDSNPNVAPQTEINKQQA